MNKGLFAHLVATFIYCLCVMYVVGSDETTMDLRLGIIIMLFFMNIIPAIISDLNGWYKQRM